MEGYSERGGTAADLRGRSQVVQIEEGELRLFRSAWAEQIYAEGRHSLGDFLQIKEGHHHLSFDSGERAVPAIDDKSMGRFAEPRITTGFLPNGPQSLTEHAGERFILRKTGDALVAAMVPSLDSAVAHQNVYVCRAARDSPLSTKALCALLCSETMTRLYQHGPMGQPGRTMAQLRIGAVRRLPIVDLEGLNMRHLWRPGIRTLLKVIEVKIFLTIVKKS